MVNKSMNKSMKYSLLIIILFIIAFIIFQLVTEDDYEAEVLFHTETGSVSFYCTIADTPVLRQQGLLGVEQLDSERGMIFIYDQPVLKTYTMKQMLIPLDIIFIDEQQKVIHIVEADIGMEQIESNGQFLYVVEINKGLASKHNIMVGSTMEFIER